MCVCRCVCIEQNTIMTKACTIKSTVLALAILYTSPKPAHANQIEQIQPWKIFGNISELPINITSRRNNEETDNKSVKMVSVRATTYQTGTVQIFRLPAEMSNYVFNFRVRGSSNSQILLLPKTKLEVITPHYTIILGSNGKADCTLSHIVCLDLDAKVQIMRTHQEADFLKETEFLGFRIEWDEIGDVAIYRESQYVPFLNWQNPAPFAIGAIGIRTINSVSEWILELPPNGMEILNQENGQKRSAMLRQPISEQRSDGQLSPTAVIGGYTCSEEPIYVIRASHGDLMLPGQLLPSDRCAVVTWRGQAFCKRQYQVLTRGPYKWVTVNANSTYYDSAFPIGYSLGERLYSCRVQFGCNVFPGRSHQSHRQCYIMYKGREIGFKDYQILIVVINN